MTTKFEEYEIDGIKFTTQQFGGFRALELMGELAQVIGPALGVLSSADPETPLEQLAPVLAMALRGMKPEELSTLALKVLASTQAVIDVNGTLKRVDIVDKSSFDRVFTGRLMTMFKVALRALQINYADFGFGSAPAKDAPAPQTETE